MKILNFKVKLLWKRPNFWEFYKKNVNFRQCLKEGYKSLQLNRKLLKQ